MKSLLLRGLDKELYNKIKKESEEESISMNKLIISILNSRFGFAEKQKRMKREYDDLKSLFGRWDSKQYMEINNAVSEQRKIDEDLWK